MGCWLWFGSKDGYGHPIASVHGRVVRVKQLNFEKSFTYRPKRIGMTCGKMECVNPAHMFDEYKQKRVTEINNTLYVLEPKLRFWRDTVDSIKEDKSALAISTVAEFQSDIDKTVSMITALRAELTTLNSLQNKKDT